jgi:glutamyl-tRNA reductase
MWQELVLVHRDSKAGEAPLEGSGQLWRTCLRELLFLDPGAEPLPAPGTLAYRGLDAHRALVEICSGLQSPLFGETEVFGQFRAFRETAPLSPVWQSLLSAVEEDVRKLRRKFLTDIGSQSYGSLARRHLPAGSRVVVVGSGRLAKDLLPWLEGMQLTLVARSPEKALEWLPSSALALPLSALASSRADLANAHWVIAAPLPNEELDRYWEKNPAGLVLDFRGDQHFAETPASASAYLGLRALYRELEAVKQLHERKKKDALAYAAELTKRHEQSVLHRPFGWEDAFA